MLHQGMLDLRRTDAIARAGDDIVLAADVPEVTVVILHAEIAGEQEAVRIFLRSGLRVLPVFDHGHRIGHAHADDAARVPRLLLALLIDNAHIESGRRFAHRARLDRKQMGIVGKDQIAFGLAVDLVHIDAEGGAHPLDQFGAKRLAPGEDAAQLHAVMPDVRLPHQLQCGGRQEHIAHAVIGHQLHRRLRLELLGAIAEHRHAVIPRREQRIEQAADPGPVRRRPHQVAGLRKEIMCHLDIGQMAEQHAMGVQRALRIPCRA